ncbi:relaxase/mobilization nuclease domain-containing protein [uncultured Treponema sp.]|uniref:relaxase/mobilization nuclease domain-containing protein n=1 Tax=uncultured Treponema sp. TaxID=162155 RepID=UPI002606FA39|nr:relaxase/mobilization nuclease domain-containing protein [uncultured Treponema sp.]
MAILKAVNVKVGRNASLKGIINYVLQPKKTEEQLSTGFCCDVPKALETFNETKDCFGKMKGRQYYHFVQSFPPNENISAKKAHEVALRFAEKCKKFWGFEMLIVTHKDRKHLHTHFVMNSVSFLDGHKFHMSRKELAAMKELQNKICIELGYSAAPKKGIDIFGKKRTNVTANNAKIFRILKKAENKQKDSYLMNCEEAFLKSIKMAKTKEQFIQLMHAQGFVTEWKENKKHIVFTDIKRKAAGGRKCKVRLNKLAQYFPSLKNFKTKEDLFNEIQRNNTIRIESDDNRFFVAGIDSNKSKAGTTAELIDFNKGYEEYSARIDKERDVRAAEEAARLAGEVASAERRRIAEEQRTAQLTAERDERRIQQQDRALSKGDRKSTEQTLQRKSGGYHR